MSVTVNRDGVLRPAEQDARLMTAMLPSPCPQNHAANLLPLPDGSLLCVWFGGTQEGVADISVYSSRLTPGADRWSEAVKLS
ncbi:MAG TPA: glycosyl hydrolase, partial [Pantoea septica]|nr:glycosyl hydrolase [Pantoea septica]